MTSRHREPFSPYLWGALGAIVLFVAITLPVQFTFMADDWVHLHHAYLGPQALWHELAATRARVPVWTVAAWALFASQILEQSWWPMWLFFGAHAVGLALIARGVVVALAPWARSVDSGRGRGSLLAAAVAVVALHPNAHEILFWPTGMPYAVGVLLLGLAVTVSPRWLRTALLAATCLTYETFILPALALVLLTPVAQCVLEKRCLKEAWRPVAVGATPWLIAVGIMLAVRGGMAMLVGTYAHSVTFEPAAILSKVSDAAKQVFQLRFYRAGTHLLGSGTQLALLAGAIGLLWRSRDRRRLRATWLLLATCLASTAVYWLLPYGAMRATYGSLVLFCAVLVWVMQAVLATVPKRAGWVAVGLATLGIGYGAQLAEIFSVKNANARVLVQQENALNHQLSLCARQLAATGVRVPESTRELGTDASQAADKAAAHDSDACVVQYAQLDKQLQQDWVLPPDPSAYWDSYLERLRLRHPGSPQARFARLGQ